MDIMDGSNCKKTDVRRASVGPAEHVGICLHLLCWQIHEPSYVTHSITLVPLFKKMFRWACTRLPLESENFSALRLPVFFDKSIICYYMLIDIAMAIS
jgi:hypothetical protein